MKKCFLIAVIVIAATSSKAQSAVALYKPLYGGDEKYSIAFASTEQDFTLFDLFRRASRTTDKRGFEIPIYLNFGIRFANIWKCTGI